VPLNTVALELVPPNTDRSPDEILDEARKVVRFSAETGLDGRIRHVMIPGMIAEDDDRPVEMKPKLDVLDYWSRISPELPGVKGLCTQVTAFMDEPSLRQRLTDLGITPMWSTSEEFRKRNEADIVVWRKAVQDVGAKLD